MKISEEDKQALAEWIFRNPRGPPAANQRYFERFVRHVSRLNPVLMFCFCCHGSNCHNGLQQEPCSISVPFIMLTMSQKHKHLPSRSWNTWMNAVSNHKEDIAVRQHKFKQSRRKTHKGRHPSISSVSSFVVLGASPDVFRYGFGSLDFRRFVCF